MKLLRDTTTKFKRAVDRALTAALDGKQTDLELAIQEINEALNAISLLSEADRQGRRRDTA